MASKGLRPVRLRFNGRRPERFTHYLFRYPAKFHPPIAATLVERFSKAGDSILDPFCGSGTLLVEARLLGRTALGLDIDPVAVFIADAKTRYIGAGALKKSAQELCRHLTPFKRSRREYELLQFEDISERKFKALLKKHRLVVPSIPNIFHWFRRYVVLDLALIRRAVRRMRAPAAHKKFFLACFCSIIRNVSNADPVPVSGLEVTSHMKRKEREGRLIDPYSTFETTVKHALEDRSAYEQRLLKTYSRSTVRTGDATELRRSIRKKVDGVITSPPYHNAVDYYRRHALEMYWLDLVENSDERLALLPKYIGRARVPQTHRFIVKAKLNSKFARRYESMIRRQSTGAADAFKHYAVAMQKCFASLAELVKKDGNIVFVLGKSSWNGRKLPTTRLFEELAQPHFEISEHLWYPLKNRYMTYSRHNGANIDREHVLVFRPVRRSSKKAR